jgi:hypothetical protein
MHRMGIEALYRKPRLSQPGAGHKIYPHLLSAVSIEPYFESTGDSGRRGLFRYFSFNTWTDAPQSMLVPLTVAMEAAVLFSDTGRLSSSIEWIEPGPRRH